MKRTRAASLAAALAFWSGGAEAQTAPADSGEWKWRANLYGWFPTADADANIGPPGSGNTRIKVNPDNYLSKLDFAFMGTLEARKGPWSIVADAVYFDFGNTRSAVIPFNGPVGPVPISAVVHGDLKGFVGALEGGYSLVQTPTANFDVVAGVRYLRVETQLDWQLGAAPPGVPTQGSVGTTKDFWDGIVGVRGRSDFGDKWYVSYYADAGGGSSKSTWQAFGGIGYHFKWGDALLGYRHLEYRFDGASPLSDLKFSGPLVGVGFNF